MKRNLYFIFLIIFLIVGCNNKKEEVKVFGVTVNDLQKDSIDWINDELGFDNAFMLKDTMVREDDKSFAYGSNIVLPKLISKKSDFKTLNNKIMSDFQTIIEKVNANPKHSKDEYQKVNYTYYLKDSIITIKIEDINAYHLSEATSEYFIYHFDFKNDKLLTTSEMFQVLGLSQVPILNAFAEQCALPPDYLEPLFNTEWFDKVKWNDLNQMKFYQNDKHQLVIIYPMIENGIEGEIILE